MTGKRTLKVVHPKGDTLKAIDLPEGSTVMVGGQRILNVNRLEVLVPHDFALTANVERIEEDADGG